MPEGGTSALRQFAKADFAPACCSASLSSHSMLTAPSKPTRFSSMKISSSELASRSVPAATDYESVHPLALDPGPTVQPSRQSAVCAFRALLNTREVRSLLLRAHATT